MNFEALVGRAAHYSSDAVLVVQKSSVECEGLVLLYANPTFVQTANCVVGNDGVCACTMRLGDIDLSNQALLSVTDGSEIAQAFRVSVTALPESETGKPDCFMLVGRSSGASLSEGRVRLYSTIARKFIEMPANEAVHASVRAAGLYFDANRCFAARLNLSHDTMGMRYMWRKNDQATKKAPCDKSQNYAICDWVKDRLRQGEVVTVNSVDDLPDEAFELRNVLNACNVKAAILAPVLLARGTLWFIGIHSTTHTRQWTQEDVNTFKVVGDLLGNAFTQTEIVWSLKETQKRFNDVGANIPGVVYQLRQNGDKSPVFSYISQGIRDLAGWGPASMMSEPDRLERLILNEDRGRYRETLQRAGLNLSDWSIDVRIRHRHSDEIKWVRSSGRAHRGSNNDTVWNGLILDISEHHQAEEALRVSEERLRRILGTSPIAIGISDALNFRLLFANKRLAEMYRIPKSSVIGYDTRKFYAQPELHRRHWVETRREKFVNSAEMKCERADGSTFWAEITTRLIDYGGNEAILWWAFDITEHKNTKEALAHLAHHDALTGLANRRLFDEHLKNAVALASRNERPGVLFYFDLDGFKAVNDEHGHGFGDWVLDQVGQRLRSVLRDSDIGARLGGDEFAVIAQGIDDIRAIESVVDKLQSAISAPYVSDDKTANIGLSIGIVRFFGHETSTQQIVMLADSAMYEAKQAGKGTFRLINMPRNQTQAALS